MKINKAYKFRMYPANEQIVLLEKSFCTSRFIYNYYLTKSKDKYTNCFNNIKDLVISSESIKYKNLKLIKEYEKKFKVLNRWLARCQKGSKNRVKLKLKLQTIYKKIKECT